MRHPGPLQELPLEQFLPQSSSRPIKRPLSPGVSKLLSPVKRRFLNEEGLLPIANPTSPPSQTPRQSSLGRFSDALNGPGSPAKVLDFGFPKNYPASLDREANVASTTPRRPVTRSMMKLAPSPELSSGQGPSRHNKEPADSMFDSSSSCSSTSRSPLYVPRDLPPPPDPQSIHYPGFEIHRDPYTIIFRLADGPQPESTKDEVKENVPCRRKNRKASDKAEAHLRAVSQEPTNDYAHHKSPKKIFSMHANITSPTSASRRLGIGPFHVNSLVSSPRNEQHLQKERKIKLMEEVDDVGCDINDDEEA